MNEKSRPARRPLSTTSAPGRIIYEPAARLLIVVEDAVARIVWIREDATPFEAEQALADLEDDLVGALAASTKARASVCPNCALDCRWPGRLSDHLRVVHGEAA
jgi:hypothetical protein